MTRKQWINSLTEQQLKEMKPYLDGFANKLDAAWTRNFLRKMKITDRHIRIQKGRLAAGLPILPISKLVQCN